MVWWSIGCRFWESCGYKLDWSIARQTIKIYEVLCNYSEMKTLKFHANCISGLKGVDKLSRLTNLRKLIMFFVIIIKGSALHPMPVSNYLFRTLPCLQSFSFSFFLPLPLISCFPFIYLICYSVLPSLLPTIVLSRRADAAEVYLRCSTPLLWE